MSSGLAGRATTWAQQKTTTEGPSNSSRSPCRGPAIHSPRLTAYKPSPPQFVMLLGRGGCHAVRPQSGVDWTHHNPDTATPSSPNGSGGPRACAPYPPQFVTLLGRGGCHAVRPQSGIGWTATPSSPNGSGSPRACKPSIPQFVHNAVSFVEIDLVDTSINDEWEASPQEPPKPLGTRLCPTCGKTCSHTSALNKHMKEVHSGTTVSCRNCPRTYKTKSNRVNASCSSQENITTRPTELELVVARDLIRENLTRNQAADKMADIHRVRIIAFLAQGLGGDFWIAGGDGGQ